MQQWYDTVIRPEKKPEVPPGIHPAIYDPTGFYGRRPLPVQRPALEIPLPERRPPESEPEHRIDIDRYRC